MKVSLLKHRLVLALFSTALVAVNFGCSSDEKPEEGEVISADEDGGGEAKAAATEETSDEEVQQSEDVLKGDDSEAVEAVTEPEAPTEKAPIMPDAPATTETKPAAPAKAAPAAASNWSSKRAVWFVKADSVSVHEKPNAKSKAVGTMSKGDHFVGEADGEWAKISETRWVMTKDLSSKPVARKRGSSEWQQTAPTH